MSKIDELLKDEKVEWKKLGEVANIGTGKSNTNEQIEDGDYPFYVRSKIIKRSNKYEFNETAIIIPGEGGIGEVFHYVEGKYALHQRAYRIHIVDNEINSKFVYYYMIQNFKEYIMKNAVSATVSSIRKPMIENFELPILSIDVQKKIVEVLDKFTNYVTELQAELQARTKQYGYYRDMLLSEEYLKKVCAEIIEIEKKEYKVKVKTLGEIGYFTRGNGLQKKDFISEGKPVVHYGQIYTKYGFETEKVYSFVSEDIFSKLKKAKCNDILIASTSENVEDVGKSLVWLGNEEVGFSGDMYSYRTSENSKYIAYYFTTRQFQRQKERKVTGAKMIRIHENAMKNFLIPLPPLEIQNKVVEMLDKLQSLLSDTKGLLPKEIELRQKQYEYYREQLLDFKK
jgi:putative type I restriction-modification system S protein